MCNRKMSKRDIMCCFTYFYELTQKVEFSSRVSVCSMTDMKILLSNAYIVRVVYNRRGLGYYAQ